MGSFQRSCSVLFLVLVLIGTLAASAVAQGASPASALYSAPLGACRKTLCIFWELRYRACS